MNLAAFWIPVALLFALSALASVAVAAMQGTAEPDSHRFGGLRRHCCRLDADLFPADCCPFSRTARGQCSRRAPSGGGATVDRTQLDPGRAD